MKPAPGIKRRATTLLKDNEQFDRPHACYITLNNLMDYLLIISTGNLMDYLSTTLCYIINFLPIVLSRERWTTVTGMQTREQRASISANDSWRRNKNYSDRKQFLNINICVNWLRAIIPCQLIEESSTWCHYNLTWMPRNFRWRSQWRGLTSSAGIVFMQWLIGPCMCR